MTRIISPLARVTIGKDVFVAGDGILKSVSVEIGENARSSRCNFALYDKGLLIGAKYQAISFAQGGIITPEGLLKEKESTPDVSDTPTNPTLSSAAGAAGSGGSARNTSLSPEERAFLDTIAFGEGTWGRGDDGYNVIVNYKYFSDYSRHPDVYVRSANSTAAGRYQFLNTTWNGKPGRPGLKQQLKLKDFSPASQDLGGIELVKQAGALSFVRQGSKGFEKAVELCSYTWASFPPPRYPQKTRPISELKNFYIKALLKYQDQSPAQAAAATQPEATKKPSADNAKPTTLKDKADSKAAEVTEKGCEIIVELGFSLTQMISFHFFHTGTTTSRGQLDETVFEGQMIRWLLHRRTQNTAYTKITLRQLAQMICNRYRLKLDMEGNGPTYQYLDVSGISDYELLLREARAIGYTIREDKNILILKPVRPNFTGFVITRNILQTIKFGDRASADRASTPGTTTSTPDVAAAESKTKNERMTGKPTQTKTEDSTATGMKSESKVAVTGAATSAVHGTTIPDTSVTGLPKQEIGAIDLGDGKAEAAEIKDESKRVKGYESQASLITTPEILTIVPGSIIGVSDEVAPPPFNREWRVATVRHTLSTSGMRSELSFYSPQAAKEGNGSVSTSDTTAAPATEVKPGGFVLPAAGTTGDGVNGGGNGHRKHTGVDIANAQGTPIVASASGTVYKALGGCTVGDDSCHGGYGNNIVIQHENGYFTRYAHLRQILVTQGQKVKQGQKIGTMGNTGRSSGSHLHFEIRKGGSFTDQAVVFSDVGLVIPQKHNKGFRY